MHFDALEPLLEFHFKRLEHVAHEDLHHEFAVLLQDPVTDVDGEHAEVDGPGVVGGIGTCDIGCHIRKDDIRLAAELLKKLGIERTVLVVQKQATETVYLAASNIARVDYSTADALDVYTILQSRKILCDKAGFDALMARIAK